MSSLNFNTDLCLYTASQVECPPFLLQDLWNIVLEYASIYRRYEPHDKRIQYTTDPVHPSFIRFPPVLASIYFNPEGPKWIGIRHYQNQMDAALAKDLVHLEVECKLQAIKETCRVLVIHPSIMHSLAFRGYYDRHRNHVKTQYEPWMKQDEHLTPYADRLPLQRPPYTSQFTLFTHSLDYVCPDMTKFNFNHFDLTIFTLHDSLNMHSLTIAKSTLPLVLKSTKLIAISAVSATQIQPTGMDIELIEFEGNKLKRRFMKKKEEQEEEKEGAKRMKLL